VSLASLLGDHLVASAALLGGLAVNITTPILAAASDTDITPWTTIGSNAAVVAALIFFAKEFVRGKIVAEPIDHLLREATEREDKLRDLAKRSQDREDLLWSLLQGRGL
jgi:hypothetical protein